MRRDPANRPRGRSERDPTSSEAALPLDLSELRERLERTADVRLDKIEAICRSLASGQYRVDPAAIAERILGDRRLDESS